MNQDRQQQLQAWKHPGARCARCRVQLTSLHDEDACNGALARRHGPWWPNPGTELIDVTPAWAERDRMIGASYVL